MGNPLASAGPSSINNIAHLLTMDTQQQPSPDDTKVDVIHSEFRESQPAALAYVPGTAEERALVRKIDRRMLPMLWWMYVFNYIDRTNIGVSAGSCVGANRISNVRATERQSRWDGGRSSPQLDRLLVSAINLLCRALIFVPQGRRELFD
jgi:hypothetical protein